MILVPSYMIQLTTVDIHLYKYKMTRINCVILLTSIIWLWFQTQLDDAKDAGLFEEKVTIDVCGGCVNDTKGLNDSCQCLCEKTDIFMNFDAASVYLYAFIVEYSLLVMECLLHIMLTMVDKTEHIPILPADVNITVVVIDWNLYLSHYTNIIMKRKIHLVTLVTVKMKYLCLRILK